MAAMCTLPWHDNPLGWVAPGRSYKVLYLDWETDENTIKWSLKCLTEGMGLGYLSLNYRRCSFPLARDVEQIAEWIEDTKADITIIDSLGMAAGGDLSATEPAFAFWAAWRKLKTTSLILAHNAKASADGNKTVFGSQFYSAEARCIWEIRKVQEPGSREMDLAMYHRKAPPFDMLRQATGLHVSYEGVGRFSDGMVISPGNPQSVPEFLESLSSQDRIKMLLDKGRMTTQEIIEELGINGATARSTLARMKGKNIITKWSDGSWELVLRA